MGRVAPFVAVTLLAVVISPLSHQHVDGTLLLVASLLIVLMLTSPWYVPWEQRPFWMQAIPPISYYLVIALLREAGGGATSGLEPLVALPVIWLALYGTRAELKVGLLAAGATFIVPAALIGDPRYPNSDFTRGMLWVAVSLIVGVITQRLVEQVRERAAASERQADILRQNEERIRLILETAHEAFIAIDAKGLITSWNAQAEETFRWSQEEAIGRELASTIIPPQYRDAHRRGLERFLQTGEGPVLNQPLELTAVRRNGDEFPVELTISPLKTAQGYVFNAFLRDITERHEADEALRESQQKLESILSNNPAVIYAKDRDYRYLLVNQEFERLFNRDSEDLIGKTDEHFLPPELVEPVRANDRRVLETGETVLGEEIVPRDGELRTYASSKFPLLDADGTPYAVCGISTDITDRKRAEEYFKAQHEVTRVLAQIGSLAEVMPAVLESLGEKLGWELGVYWSIDERAKVLRFEESWHGDEPTLRDFDALTRPLTFECGSGLPGHVWKTGRPMRIANLLDDQNVPRARAALKQGFQSAIALPIQSGQRCFGVLEFFSRESKALDEDLVEMLGALGGQLAQFIERKRAEQEAERLKEEFFSLVSHEFRTPLTSIVGYVEILQEGFETDLSTDEQARFLDVIKRNSERLRRLVNDLLFISKVQAGNFSITPRSVDMRAVAAQCLETASPTAQEKSIELRLEADDVPNLYGDPDRLAQLLDNLVSNAVKYTPEGECVELRLERQYDQLVAEVTNTGVHIPAEELEHLFERFYRASTATAGEAQGVGLGLTIAQAIVRAHGGEILVTSSPQRGTTFRVQLPFPQEAGDRDPQAQPRRIAA